MPHPGLPGSLQDIRLPGDISPEQLFKVAVGLELPGQVNYRINVRQCCPKPLEVGVGADIQGVSLDAPVRRP